MSKPVTVRFVGDESRFRATTEAVGGRLRDFGKQAEQEGRRAGAGFDRAAEGADNAEGKAQGFASTLTGTKDLMTAAGEIGKGNLFEGFVMAGQGAADLAEGLNYTVIPTVKGVVTAFTQQGLATIRSTATAIASRVAQTAAAAASKAWAAAQWLLNAAMTANPIGIVIAIIVALVAAVVIAYKRSETFRNIVQGAFRVVQAAGRAMWEGLRAAFNAIVAGAGRLADFVVNAARRGFLGPIPWIISNWGKVTAFFRELPAKIRSFLAGLPDALRRLGAAAMQAFINGLKSMAGAILAAIRAIIPDPIEKFLHLSSPAKEGPLSKDGGPEGWGRRAAELYTRGLASGAGGLRGAVGDLALAGVPRLAGTGGGMRLRDIIVNVTTGADAHQIGREVAWALKTSGY